MAYRGRRGRGQGGRRPKNQGNREDMVQPLPLVRPIFDWTEVGEQFIQAAPLLDNSFLAQLLLKQAESLILSVGHQKSIQTFITKVCTVVDNMIVSGEGDSMLLDEVRVVGSQKMGIAMKGDMVGEVVIILRDLPTPALVSKISVKIMECLEVDRKERLEKERDDVEMFNSFTDTAKAVLKNETNNSFELCNSDNVVARVLLTTSGIILYGGPRRDRNIENLTPFEDALRKIRRARWWEEETVFLNSVCDLVRILVSMRDHVPGLKLLTTWHIQLISHCAVVPLIGDEPLSLVDSFRRIWELLSAGLFLPGSVGIPDPCEEANCGIHESFPNHQLDELTRNAQMILQMLSFGAYREVLAMEGATPINFVEAYSFGGVTLGVPAPVLEQPNSEILETDFDT